MQLSTREAAVALLILAAMLAAGCGSKSSSGSGTSSSGQSSQPLTGASFDPRLQSALNSGSGGGSKVTSVNCPSNITAAAGAMFTCQVTAQGSLSGTVTVTLRDAKGKSYSYKGTLRGNGEQQTVSGSTSS